MNLILRYILREFSKIFLLALGALLSLYMIFDFFENVEKFVQNQVPISYTLLFFLLRLPQGLFYMIPVALLLSSVLNFGLFSKRKELIAMKACGINPHRLMVPVLLSAFLISLLVFVLNASLIPTCNLEAENIYRQWVQHKPRDFFFKQNSLWFRADPQTIYNIDVADPDQKILRGVDLYRLSPSFQMVERIHADVAVFQKNQWLLIKATRWSFGDEQHITISHFEETPAILSIQLNDFPNMTLQGREMKFGELRNYVERLRREGYEVRKLTVDLYSKTSFPLAGGVLTLIGTSLALMELRRGGIAIGIGLSLILSFAYWMFFSFALSLGYTGHLPPFFSAWAANVLFGTIGIYLAFQIKR